MKRSATILICSLLLALSGCAGDDNGQSSAQTSSSTQSTSSATSTGSSDVQSEAADDIPQALPEDAFAAMVRIKGDIPLKNAQDYSVKEGVIGSDVVFGGVASDSFIGATDDNTLLTMGREDYYKRRKEIGLYSITDDSYTTLVRCTDGFSLNIHAFNERYIVYEYSKSSPFIYVPSGDRESREEFYDGTDDLRWEEAGNTAVVFLTAQEEEPFDELHIFDIEQQSDRVIWGAERNECFDTYSPDSCVIIDDKVYYTHKTNGRDADRDICCYDISSDELAVFKSNAYRCSEYQGGLVYYDPSSDAYMQYRDDTTTELSALDKGVVPYYSGEHFFCSEYNTDVTTYKGLLNGELQDIVEIYCSCTLSGISDESGMAVWTMKSEPCCMFFYDIGENAFVKLSDTPVLYEAVAGNEALFFFSDNADGSVGYLTVCDKNIGAPNEANPSEETIAPQKGYYDAVFEEIDETTSSGPRPTYEETIEMLSKPVYGGIDSFYLVETVKALTLSECEQLSGWEEWFESCYALSYDEIKNDDREYFGDKIIYEVKVIEDLISGEESDRKMYLSVAMGGNPRIQRAGDPIYAPGERFTVAVHQKPDDSDITRSCGGFMFRFDVEEDNGNYFALSRGDFGIDELKNSNCAVDISLDTITSTTNNPAHYTCKIPLDDLTEYLREDWSARGIR